MSKTTELVVAGLAVVRLERRLAGVADRDAATPTLIALHAARRTFCEKSQAARLNPETILCYIAERFAVIRQHERRLSAILRDRPLRSAESSARIARLYSRHATRLYAVLDPWSHCFIDR